jgi:3-deoxy-D-manno-octulosonic-acid transferase
MSTIFDAAYVAALACGSPYFLFKILKDERYRSGLLQRFGKLDKREEKNPCVWIHCASVGEVLTVKTLVKSIEKEFNNWNIVISTNTNTGLSVAKKCFDGRKIFYFPLDLSWVVNKSFVAIRPHCIVLVELELWPNFLMKAAQERVPVVLVNARISEKSLNWYRIVSKISKSFLESLARKENVFCARTKIDADRLMELGLSREQIHITGNMKFDNIVTTVPEDVKKRLFRLFEIGETDRVIVCGSTHEGEESVILSVFERICKKITGVRLIIAPRHIERCRDILRLIENRGLRCVRKTQLDAGERIGERKSETIILIDTIGELVSVYSLADCVFVGKSLVPQGGQNMMEPAGLAIPAIVGPHTFNFNEEVLLLKNADAIRIVQDESSLFNEFMYLLEHPFEAGELGKRARSVVMGQSGAAERNLKVLRNILLKERIVSI